MTITCIKSDCPVFGWNVSGSYFFTWKQNFRGPCCFVTGRSCKESLKFHQMGYFLFPSQHWQLLQVYQNMWSPPLRFHQWSNFYNVSTVGLAQVMMPDPHTEQEVHFHCQYLSCTRPWKLIKFLKPINRNLSGCIRHQFYWNPNTL